MKTDIGFKSILVGTDFSDYSERAIAHASVLAKQFDAKITLLHVIESFSYSLTDSMTVVGHDQALSTTAAALLENLQNTLIDEGLSVDRLLEHGAPYKQIIKIAEEKSVNLIVVGTHGRTGMEHLLLGGVSEKVVRLAKCPVLTVPGK
ncbi:MAG: universal stress protein [Nitrospiria bacterium]